MSETQTIDPTVTIVEPEKKEAPTPSPEKKAEAPPTEKKVEPEKKAPSLLNEPDPEKKDEPKAGAPEKYEDWKLPEGFTMSEEQATEVTSTFKELGISQEAGQKLVDLYAKQIQGSINAPVETYLEMRKGWRDEVKADPVLKNLEGDKGVKVTISRALDGLGLPAEQVEAYKEAMDLTGAGDHPAFIRVLYALAQKAVEGKHVSGKGPADQGRPKTPTSPAQAMYPNLPSANQS